MNTNNLPQPATPSADDLARTLAARQQAQAATAQTQASRAEGSSASAHHTKPTRTRPTKRRRKGLRNGIIAGATAITLALGGTTAWALNRYVIDHVEVTSASSYEASQGNAQSTSLNTDTATTTSDTYTNGNTKISVKQVQNNGVTYYVADVQLSDATALRSAFANDQFGANITDLVSSIATDNNAVFAINGDYYGFRSTGIVIRNGTIYRDSGARQGLAIYKDGTMKVYDETQTNAQTLVNEGVWQTLSFGPALLQDGQVISGIDNLEIDTNFGNHSIQGKQPRTAIGIIDDNHFVFVVVDGRSRTSSGVTMSGLAEIMQSLGAKTAYNLDGGGSSEMWFNGQVVNNPSNGGERATSDIIYITKGA